MTSADFSNEEFKTDETGQKLRYKILVKNDEVFAVLYNTGKMIERIPFKEERVDLSTLYKVDKAKG